MIRFTGRRNLLDNMKVKIVREHPSNESMAPSRSLTAIALSCDPV